MGRKSGGGIAIWIVASAFLLAWSPGVMAQGLLDTLESTSQLHGYLETQEIFRGTNFVKNWSVASFRNRIDLQPSGTLLKNINLGPLIKNGTLEYFMELRPEYEGIYDTNAPRFGTNTTGFSSWAYSPFDRHLGGIAGPHFGSTTAVDGNALLKSEGYNLKNFSYSSSGPFTIPDPNTLGMKFQKPCLNCFMTMQSEGMLRFGVTDYNQEWYPLREGYMDFRWDFLGENWLRIGRQQVVWGKSDFFRLQDVVNPVDYSQHFFIEPFEDTRIPQLAATLQHRFGDIGFLRDVAATFVWNFDQFQPLGIGQTGMPWSTTFGNEATGFGFDNGVFSKGLCPPGSAAFKSGACNPMPTNQLNFGTYKWSIPNWRMRNGGVGVKVDWEIPNPEIRFAFTDYLANNATPVFAAATLNIANGLNPQCASLYTLKGGPAYSQTLANGLPLTITAPGNIALASGVAPNLFMNECGFGGSFNAKFHRMNTMGLSADYFEPNTGLVFRMESSWAHNVLLNNMDSLNFETTGDVFAYVLGIDKPHFIKFLNPDRTFFSSVQVFETWYPNEPSGQGGKTGLITGVNNFIVTAFTQTHYYRDQIIPLIFGAFGSEGQDATIGANTEYLMSDHWSAQVGIDAFVGSSTLHDLGPYASFMPCWKAGASANSNMAGKCPQWQETFFGFAHNQAGGFERNYMDEVWTRVRYRF